jgi:hypothetical protein
MPNADPLNLKTDDVLSVPGAGGKTSKYSQEDKKWGFGIVGTIVGYAVRGPL